MTKTIVNFNKKKNYNTTQHQYYLKLNWITINNQAHFYFFIYFFVGQHATSQPAFSQIAYNTWKYFLDSLYLGTNGKK